MKADEARLLSANARRSPDVSVKERGDRILSKILKDIQDACKNGKNHVGCYIDEWNDAPLEYGYVKQSLQDLGYVLRSNCTGLYTHSILW